jgi:hypothetical protein
MTSKDQANIYPLNVNSEFQSVIITPPTKIQETSIVTCEISKNEEKTTKQSEASFIEKSTIVILPVTIILFFLTIIGDLAIQIANMAKWKKATNNGGFLANYIITFIFELPLFIVGVVGILSVIPKFSHQTQIKLGTGYLLSLFTIITIEHILNTAFTVAGYGSSSVILTPMAFFLIIPSVIRILLLNKRLCNDNTAISLAEKTTMATIPIITMLFFLWLIAIESVFIGQMAQWKKAGDNGGLLANYIISFLFVLPLFVVGVVGITSIIPKFNERLKLGLNMAVLGALFVLYVIEVILVLIFAAGAAGTSFIMSYLMLMYMAGSLLLRAHFLNTRLTDAQV